MRSSFAIAGQNARLGTPRNRVMPARLYRALDGMVPLPMIRAAVAPASCSASPASWPVAYSSEAVRATRSRYLSLSFDSSMASRQSRSASSAAATCRAEGKHDHADRHEQPARERDWADAAAAATRAKGGELSAHAEDGSLPGRPATE